MSQGPQESEDINTQRPSPLHKPRPSDPVAPSHRLLWSQPLRTLCNDRQWNPELCKCSSTSFSLSLSLPHTPTPPRLSSPCVISYNSSWSALLVKIYVSKCFQVSRCLCYILIYRCLRWAGLFTSHKTCKDYLMLSAGLKSQLEVPLAW